MDSTLEVVPISETPNTEEASILLMEPKFDSKPDVVPNPDVDSKLLCCEEEEDSEDHDDCEFSPLDDPESWTVTAGLLLTVPVKLVIGADPEIPFSPPEKLVVVTGAGPDSPLKAAAIAASICGPSDLNTDSTTDSASTAEFIL